MFAGRNAVHFKVAEEARRTYTSPADNLPRFEIPDHEARLKGAFVRQINGSGRTEKLNLTLGAILEHPALFNQYPELAYLPVEAVVRTDKFRADFTCSKIRLSFGPKYSKDRALSLLLHEVQHAIQLIEGFSQGSNTTNEFQLVCDQKIRSYTMALTLAHLEKCTPAVDRLEGLIEKAHTAARFAGPLPITSRINPTTLLHHRFYNLADSRYRARGGEVEANDVQARQMLTAAQRLFSPPANSKLSPHKHSHVSVYYDPRAEMDLEERATWMKLNKARKRLTGAGYAAIQTP